jgi:hypothetical protein
MNQSQQSQIAISAVCDELKQLLLEKNFQYGDAALNPLSIFSLAPARERINSRMDEKISRIKNQTHNRNGPKDDEDARKDLAGCLILSMALDKVEAANLNPNNQDTDTNA